MSLSGYLYTKEREMPATEAGVKIYWICENRECKGRVTTVNDVPVRETGHNLHAPSPQEAEVKKSMARLKEAASCSQDAPSRLVNKELQDNLPPEVRGYWPKEATVKRRIQRERRKHFPALPDSLSQLEIPEAWQKSTNGDQFLICDQTSENGDRILIFATEKTFKQFGRSKTWYGDGTFHVAPQHFYQLYTLHGVVMGQLLPLVYCLLTRKHRPTYRLLFSIIKTKLEELETEIAVDSFKCDFEDAAIKGSFDIFPDVGIDCSGRIQ